MTRPRPPQRRHLVDAALIAAVAATVVIPWHGSELRAAGPLEIALGALVCIGIPLRRRWPSATVAAMCALLVIGAVAGGFHPSALIGVAAAVAGSATRGFHPVTLATSGAAVLVCGGAVWFSVGEHAFADPRLLLVVAVITIAATAGYAAGAEARRIVGDVRLQFARELHDTVAHRVAVVNLQAGAAQVRLQAGDRIGASRSLDVIQESAGGILDDIGALLTGLRDGVAGARFEAVLEEFRAAGLRIDTVMSGGATPLRPGVEQVVRLVVREGLANALKHGDGAAALTVDHGRDLILIRVTNAVSIRGAEAAPGTGHGIRGLTERVTAIGGRVTVARHGDEHSLEVVLPLTAARGARS